MTTEMEGMMPENNQATPGLTPEEAQELAKLETAFDHAGGRGVELAERIDELRAKRYSASDPRHYGVDPEEIVACYFSGTLTPEVVAEGHAYDYGYYHKDCESAARQMFTELTVEKPSIEASELDWSHPYHCDVCEESIT